MIDLAEPSQNYDIPLIGDIVVTVSPLTTASMISCRNAADRRVREISDPLEFCRESGIIPKDVGPDLKDKDVLEGLRMKFLIEELAIAHIIAWRGVNYQEKPAPLEKEMIRTLMSTHPLGQTFFHVFTIRDAERFSAKKDS